MVELKACPFCGSDGVYLVHGFHGHYVLCPNCLNEMRNDCAALTTDDLIGCWNRRV